MKKKVLSCIMLFFAVFLLVSTDGEAGWKKYGGNKCRYYVNKNHCVKSGWHKISGKWHYFDKHGWQKTGRFKVGNKYYYCKKTSGRVTNRMVGNYYYGSDGAMVKNCLKKCGKKILFFGSNGAVRYGRFKVGSNYFYADKKSGIAIKKRVADYYYGAKGAMVRSCWVGRYYYGADGKAKYGRFTVGGNTFYCTKEKGKLTSVWMDRHYYNEDGRMAVSQWIGKRYVNEKGDIIKGNKTPMNTPTEEEIRLLAAITYLEAGNQSYYGKKCVASVIVNRVQSKRFPNTLKNVVYQSGQFTPAMTGALSRLVKSKKKIQSECTKAARYVLENGSVLKGYYFFNIYSGRKKIGNHYFS